MATVIEELRSLESRILTRIRELEGNVAELQELRDLANRLGLDLDDATDTGEARRRARSLMAGSAAPTVSRATPRAARAPLVEPDDATPSRVTRRERVLELVASNPGVSVRELVDHLGVNRTSLYPVVRQLISEGLLVKDGKRLTLRA